MVPPTSGGSSDAEAAIDWDDVAFPTSWNSAGAQRGRARHRAGQKCRGNGMRVRDRSAAR